MHPPRCLTRIDDKVVANKIGATRAIKILAPYLGTTCDADALGNALVATDVDLAWRLIDQFWLEVWLIQHFGNLLIVPIYLWVTVKIRPQVCRPRTRIADIEHIGPDHGRSHLLILTLVKPKSAKLRFCQWPRNQACHVWNGRVLLPMASPCDRSSRGAILFQ